MSIKLDTPTFYSILKVVKKLEHLFLLKLVKVEEGLKYVVFEKGAAATG